MQPSDTRVSVPPLSFPLRSTPTQNDTGLLQLLLFVLPPNIAVYSFACKQYNHLDNDVLLRMSQSHSGTSHEAISGHGESSEADRSSASEGGEYEKTQPRAADAQSESEHSLEGAAEQQQPHKGNDTVATQRQRRKVKAENARSAKQYLRLLNQVIHDATTPTADDDGPLQPSQIGASFWSGSEKEAFFSKLTSCGPGDLQALSSAIGSKSQVEVHAYLQVLQDGVHELTSTQSPKDRFSLVDVPAALEIDGDCEAALDAEAAILAQKVEKRDMLTEHATSGEGWLIEEQYAASLEVGMQQGVSGSNEGHADDERVNDTAPFPAADLLCPGSFIQLSRDIFMNGPLGSAANWQEVVDSTDSSLGPGVYRTAFDNFHSLAVSLTRRLVAATLHQANCRLRASDASRTNWEPLAEAKEIDVRTATDLLCFRKDWKTYWACLPRRCGLGVYTDIATYKDGRSTTKNGVKLTYEEVEGELGVEMLESSEGGVHDAEWNVASELDLVSDDYTDVTESDGAFDEQEVVAERVSVDDMAHEPGSELDAGGEPLRKRKRAFSPITFYKAEDLYLEALDSQKSRAESRRLQEMLGQALMPEAVLESPGDRPLLSGRSVAADPPSTSWRMNLKHESEWERFDGTIPEAEFEVMQRLGGAGGRKRRRLRENLPTALIQSAVLTNAGDAAAGYWHGETQDRLQSLSESEHGGIDLSEADDETSDEHDAEQFEPAGSEL